MKTKCMVCGKVTVKGDDDPSTGGLVSHGICSEECFTRQYPDEDPLDEEQPSPIKAGTLAAGSS